MSKGRSNLLPNQVGPHVPFWANAKDMFQYPGWENHVNHVYEEFDISSDQTSIVRGTKQVFQVDRRGDRLTSMDLIIQRSVGVRNSGTGGCFEDWEAYSSIDYVDIFYNNKLVWRKRMEKRVLDIMEKCTAQERAAFARLGNGDLSYNERVTTFTADFSSPKVLVCSFGVPWEKLNKSICMLGLPNKIRVEVNWKNFADITCNPNSASLADASTKTATLRCGFYHLPEDLRQFHFAQTQSATGLRYKILTEETQIGESLSISKGVNQTENPTIRLTTLRNSVVTIKSILRQTDNIDAALSRDLFHFLGHDAYIRDNGSQVTDQANYQFLETELPITSGTRAYHKWKIPSAMYANHPTRHGAGLTRILFCPPKTYSMSEDHCFGSRNISGYNNPELYLTIVSSAAATDYFGVVPSKTIYCADGSIPASSNTSSRFSLDIYAEIHNILIQKQGDLRPLFAY